MEKLKRLFTTIITAKIICLAAVLDTAAESMANMPPAANDAPAYIVSEPTTLLLVGVGFLILAGIGNRRIKK